MPELTPAQAFWRGFALPLQAARFLAQTRGVKRYAVLPLIFNAFLYACVMVLAVYLIYEWEWGGYQWDFWGGFGAWLSEASNWLLAALKWILLLPLVFLFSYFTFTVVGMVIASPLNDILSERVERALCQPRAAPGLPLRLTLTATLLSVMDSLLIVLKQAFFSVLVLPLLLIPVVGVLPLFLVTAYFAGLGFLDVGMARNFLRHRHKRPVIQERRWEILGLGAAMELLFMIPLAGLLLLPVGVSAGTLLYCGVDWEKVFRDNALPEPLGFVAPHPTV